MMIRLTVTLLETRFYDVKMFKRRQDLPGMDIHMIDVLDMKLESKIIIKRGNN